LRTIQSSAEFTQQPLLRVFLDLFLPIQHVRNPKGEYPKNPWARHFGSASSIHARFLEWEAAGVFEGLWKSGLAEYDEMEGIAWRWQSIDGAMMEAPMAQQSVGPNPTDRGKKWEQTSLAGGRSWRPVVARRDRSESA